MHLQCIHSKNTPCTRSYADARAYGKHSIIADWNGIRADHSRGVYRGIRAATACARVSTDTGTTVDIPPLS